jgi:DNA-binding NarL/FixJ family response regulator
LFTSLFATWSREILKNDDVDCAIIDLGLPDSDNIKAVSQLKNISQKNKILKSLLILANHYQDQLELEKV